MKKGKTRQIFAIIGIVILLGLYVTTLITALMAKPYAHQMFIASVFCSLVVPVLIYAVLLIGRAFGKKDKDSMSLSQFRHANKELGQVTDSEDKMN